MKTFLLTLAFFFPNASFAAASAAGIYVMQTSPHTIEAAFPKELNQLDAALLHHYSLRASNGTKPVIVSATVLDSHSVELRIQEEMDVCSDMRYSLTVSGVRLKNGRRVGGRMEFGTYCTSR